MYLRRLELQGYKSFARKTEFVFDRGITAIVGPNGTGKSNIADAVRWALGETRMSQLRAKVTDDLIFAGSDSRARLGMAQVSMTLDNSNGRLPIDYSEVTVERRAYRDGQNEYFINGTKVRLRDIVELLGASGLTRDAYTVIGQGLVDTVLSLRPQERRALIDVAAGIRPLQDKRDRALSQLDETRDNLTRVRDIIAEIAPRLRRLEKQAERARQGAQIAEELAESLKTWYGYQWYASQQALRDAQARAEATQQALAQHRKAAAALEQRIESRRDREETLADSLSDSRKQRAELRARYEAVRRDLAVRQERMTLLQRREQELTQEIADLHAQRDEQQRQLVETEATLAELNEQTDQLAVRVESVRHKQAGAQQRKAEHQLALEDARQKAFEVASTLAETRNRLATLQERQEELKRERDAEQRVAADLAIQVDDCKTVLNDAHRKLEKHEQVLQQLTRDHKECQASLDTATARLEALSDGVHEARRRLERLQARAEALAEMRKAGSGDTAGAQALLNARDEIGGIIGSVASLIHMPAEYETAIEAALGPNLHAVVVETWDDAQRAIVWLQANRAGRATLVVRRGARVQGSRRAGEPEEPQGPEEPEGQGIIGVASDLVKCEPRHRPLIQLLLGETVIVDRLETIPGVPFSSSLASLSSPVFVTLDGTVVRPSGQITGGTIHANVLRQERLWRELPAQIQAAEAEVGRLEGGQAEARASVEAWTRRLADIDARCRQSETAHAGAQSAVEQLQRDIETLQREMAWRRSVMDRRSEELQAIHVQIEELQSQMERIQTYNVKAQRHVESLHAERNKLEVEALLDELAEAEKRLAIAQRDQQNQQTRRQDLRTALAGIGRQIEGKQSRIDALSAENEALHARIEAIANDERRLAEELSALESEIVPAEEALRTMRRGGRELEREATRARELLRQAEAAVSETTLDVQRRKDRLMALRDKIADDLELAAMGEELPRQLTLAMEDEAEVLPVVTEIPEGLERRVQQLRRQLRQVGTASPEIIAEYEETKARHDFLTSQAADLEEAAADLRAVAAELTEVMTERFAATFEEVARAFERYFRQLFGGGDASMSLIEDEGAQPSAGSGLSPSTSSGRGPSTGSGPSDPGLAIVARPPGKRSQSLALLSGGERALTAVAFIFALLRVSPTPFCILDEVDAMLDDANIGRFRSALEELAETTQFIVITHNRGTIQAADTIYGISMGDEGVSLAISLKLDELEPVAA
ncbi:MAG: chromosome segregation protein SMC [Anaerolineae bacterium]